MAAFFIVEISFFTKKSNEKHYIVIYYISLGKQQNFIYMRFICLLLFITMSTYSFSQNNKSEGEKESTLITKENNYDNPDLTKKDSLSPSLNFPIILSYPALPFRMYGITPFYHNYANWELHQGFNASIGMNITFSPSKYMPNGAGFGQDAAFMYAIPVNKRFSIAAGLYVSNFNWGYMDYRNVGFAATAAFKVNEKITLYGYGNKSIMPQRSPMYYPIPNFAPDKFGGMVNFKIGESSSISIGVEGIKGGYPYYW